MSFFNYNTNRIFYEENGTGKPLLLLHGNTASSKMFTPIIPLLSKKHTVVTMDFLGCGQSDRLEVWPVDLWYQWSEQAMALCNDKGFDEINVIGCSGGAIAAINMALEHPDFVHAVIADSFEGTKADISITNQIRAGRSYAKQNEGFSTMLRTMHGDDWEKVLDADTEAVVSHAQHIGNFFHKQLSELRTKLLLTGSAEDEMFPKGHYEYLFEEICLQTKLASRSIFKHGGHPAMMSNPIEFSLMCDDFFADSCAFDNCLI